MEDIGTSHMARLAARIFATGLVVVACVMALASAVFLVLRHFDGRPMLVLMMASVIGIVGLALVRLVLVAMEDWAERHEEEAGKPGES